MTRITYKNNSLFVALKRFELKPFKLKTEMFNFLPELRKTYILALRDIYIYIYAYFFPF